MADKIKVLLDTDIGSDADDAVALAYLLCQERCDLVGITTCTGQATLRAQLASAICRNMGRGDIPIHSGCDRAMIVDIRQKIASQATALGGWDYQRDFPPDTAIEFMRRTIRANPGEITLLSIGPLTNVGLLFATDPEIPAMLKQYVLMCGQFFYAMKGEWNARNDPHATAIAYGNGFQSRPPKHISYGLDVTVKCTLTADECRSKFTAKAMKPVRDFAEVWYNYRPAITFHDPLAAAAIFEPDLCKYRQGKVTVSLNEPTVGWTIFTEPENDRPHTAASEVDDRRFFEHYFDVVR